jgi:hypothetical protein
LASAKSLAQSICYSGEDSTFIIGLADERISINENLFDKIQILNFRDIEIDQVDQLISKSNIVEFNTALKPFFFDYFFKKYGEDVKVLYLDPDLYFYHSPKLLIDALNDHSILLTPQLLAPGLFPFEEEIVALRHGVFNLGFLGLRNSIESRRLVTWWCDRLRTHCKIDKARGLFVDQKWIDLVPVFFSDYYILKNFGCNVAWWNLGERKLIWSNNRWIVNTESCPLIFFHFSGFIPRSSFYTGRSSSPKYSFEEQPGLISLFRDYEEKLVANGFDDLNKIKPSLSFAPLGNKHGKTASSMQISLNLRRLFALLLRKY